MEKSPAVLDSGLAQTPQAEATGLTTTAVGGAEVKMVEIPRDQYEEANEENRQRNFVDAIMQARAPQVEPPYVPPPVPHAVATQTALEMEAGRKRVAEFEASEAERLKVTEAHKNDKWADKGSTSVFRPASYVPDQRKGQGHVGGSNVAV